MTKPADLIADISDAQSSFDATTYAHAGHTRIRIKATQGTSFVARTYVDKVTAAHTAGLRVDHYTFLTPSDGTAQADHFLNTVRPHLKAGDRFMADCEPDPAGGAVNAAQVNAFIERVNINAGDYDGLVYGGPYFLREGHIVSTHQWGLVLADYTTAKQPVFWPPGFSGVAREWQFTSNAHTPGIPGGSDLSRIVTEDRPKGPRDLSRRQHRRTIKFTRSMDDRTHQLTPKALTTVDSAIAAANKAKGIR